MPHYKDGTPAKVGDICLTVAENQQTKVLGVLIAIQPATVTTCNGSVLPFARKHGDYHWIPAQPQAYPDCVTLSDMARLDPVDNSTKVATRESEVGAEVAARVY